MSSINPARLNGSRTRRIVRAITDHTATLYFEADTHADGDAPTTVIRRRGPSDPWNDHTHAWIKDILSAVPGVDRVRADSTQMITVIWHPTMGM